MPTGIEWTDETWNPIIGCSRVSPGCDRCYAITNARVRESNPHPAIAAAYAGVVERTDRGIDWTGKVNLLGDRLDKPLRWARPRRIFVNAQSDLFHEAVTFDFLADVFAVMSMAPRHTFQVLTKRHGIMRSVLSSGNFWIAVNAARLNRGVSVLPGGSPLVLPNVWLGVSVEDQKWAGIRIPALLDTPAAVRFLSCEPLLGSIDLLPFLRPTRRPVGAAGDDGWSCVDWVIAGGESGRGARPMHPAWPRRIRDDCAAVGVPFLFKQWGDWRPGGSPRPNGTHRGIAEAGGGFVSTVDDATEIRQMWLFGGASIMTRVGKKAAGRTLDGALHDGYPQDAT